MDLRCDGFYWTASVFMESPWALADKLLDGGSLHDETAPQYTPRAALTMVHEAICDYYKKYLPARGVKYKCALLGPSLLTPTDACVSIDDLRANLEKYCQKYEEEVARRSPVE